MEAYPDMKTGCAAWILAGGAHHTCYSQNLTAAHMEDFAEMAGVEYVLIGKIRICTISKMNCGGMIFIIPLRAFNQ